MGIENFREVIQQLGNEFDSHEFIEKYIWAFPADYGELLVKHNNVRTAHAEIANYLRYHAEELNIERLPGKSVDQDIFGNETENACGKKK